MLNNTKSENTKKLYSNTQKRHSNNFTDSQRKGREQEQEIVSILTKTFKELKETSKYILNNVWIPSIEGPKVECDVIAFSRYAIYVIESKNYDAEIDGEIHNKDWLAHYSECVNAKLPNPVEQNERHIRALSKLLNLTDFPFISLIVFSNDSYLVIYDGNHKFNLDNNYTRNLRVARILHLNNLKGIIKSISQESMVIFTDTQLETMYNICYSYAE